MELLELYHEYKKMSEELISWLETYLNETVTTIDESIDQKIEEIKQQLESVLEKVSEIESDEHEEHIKDLRYLLTDALFLMIDLKQIAKYQDVGRFKLRAINYVSKRKRAEIFGG